MRRITWLSLLPLLFLPLLAWGAEDTWRYRAYEAEFWKRVDDKLREAKVERIAVLPFKSPPDIAEPGRYQRRIETGLIGLSGYRYIVLTRDPDEIEALMRNFAFEMSDLFDQRTVARLGKALGAQVIVSGELFKSPPAEIRLYLHLVHADAGEHVIARGIAAEGSGYPVAYLLHGVGIAVHGDDVVALLVEAAGDARTETPEPYYGKLQSLRHGQSLQTVAEALRELGQRQGPKPLLPWLSPAFILPSSPPAGTPRLTVGPAELPAPASEAPRAPCTWPG